MCSLETEKEGCIILRINIFKPVERRFDDYLGMCPINSGVNEIFYRDSILCSVNPGLVSKSGRKYFNWKNS